MKRKNKNALITVLLTILIVGSLIGCVALVNHFVNDDSKVDADGYVELNLNYKLGGLNEEGTYVDTNLSIYTKEAFSLEKIKAVLVFDSNIKYQIFYYDDMDKFISSSDEMIANYIGDTIPENATQARIMITPIWGESVKSEDKELNVFKISKYAKQLTIKVYNSEKE